MTTMLLEPVGSLFEAPRERLFRADRARAFLPATDLVASDDEMTVVMDVPGCRIDDLEIEASEGMLRVRGERRNPYAAEERGRTVQRLERGFGRFERRLRLPPDVDPSALTATIEDGVLSVRIPLPESRRPHRVEIRPADAQRAIDAEWSADGGDAGEAGGAAQADEEHSGEAGSRELAGAQAAA